MPAYHFICSEGHAVRRLLEPGGDPGPCKECGAKLVRNPQGLTTTKMERLDNGAMGKAIERPAEAERMNAERAEAHSRDNRENR